MRCQHPEEGDQHERRTGSPALIGLTRLVHHAHPSSPMPFQPPPKRPVSAAASPRSTAPNRGQGHLPRQGEARPSPRTAPCPERNVSVTLADVENSRTGAERYFADRLRDSEYGRHLEAARRRTAQVDQLVRALDERREELGLTKAELARRAGLAPEVVRRLFSIDSPNPTATTLVALADALDLEVVPRRRAS